MAEAMVKRAIFSFDESEVTATPNSVREKKVFYGSGTDNQQIGKIPDIPAINKKMEINETYQITPGIHSGEDRFYQEIPTQEAIVHVPTGMEETIEISGKYLEGNVTIEKLANYSPEFIKAGVTVGEGENAITGSFQGFVEDTL